MMTGRSLACLSACLHFDFVFIVILNGHVQFLHTHNSSLLRSLAFFSLSIFNSTMDCVRRVLPLCMLIWKSFYSHSNSHFGCLFCMPLCLVYVNPRGLKTRSKRFQASLPPGVKWLNDTSFVFQSYTFCEPFHFRSDASQPMFAADLITNYVSNVVKTHSSGYWANFKWYLRCTAQIKKKPEMTISNGFVKSCSFLFSFHFYCEF